MIPKDKEPELLKSMQGGMTMRVLREMFESVLNMGPLSSVSNNMATGAAHLSYSHQIGRV